MRDSERIMMAAIAGTAIGIAAGILLAPEKGSVTREKLADQGRRLADQGRRVADTVKDTVKEKVTAGRDLLTNLKDNMGNRQEDMYSDKGTENQSQF